MSDFNCRGFPPVSKLRSIFRSLAHLNFRLYFFGQCLSLIGTWMQQVAVSWLTYRFTHSAFWLGIVGFASQAAIFFITPFAGAIIDRFSRHKIVIATQAASFVQALLLTLLTLTGRLTLCE